jgi:predicted esterase
MVGSAAAPREVWIVLHGHGQLAGTFARYFGGLDDGATLVVAPEALSRYYTIPIDAAPANERPVGATWMTREDREAEIADYVAYLDTLMATLEAAWTPADRPRCHVVGFSQGAATAARWCALGSARVDRWILWGGLVPPDSDLAMLNRALGARSLTIVMGTRDQYTTAPGLGAEQQRLSRAGIATEIVPFEGGHAINREALRRVAGR